VHDKLAQFGRCVAVLIPAVVVLGAVTVAYSVGYEAAFDLLPDPLAVAGKPFYLGAVSVLSGLVWAVAAGGCLVAGLALESIGASRFIMSAAVMNGLLVVDDFYQIHEVVLPLYLGVPETVTYSLYAVGLSAWGTAVSSRLWRQPDRPLLLMSLMLIGASLAVEVADLSGLYDEPPMLLGSVLKYIGLFGWSVFWIRTATHLVRVDSRS
jgi:hypothetical protein